MPEISPADHTILQSGPPVVEYYLAFMRRQVIFACDLDNASATWGLATLQYDNVTVGFWQDVLSGAWGTVANAAGEDLGQTLLVYSSAGVYKGKVRVRAVNASIIRVAANNDIEWADDDQLRVLDYFEPWSRPTYMDGSGASIIYYKDTDLTWTSNVVSLPPKANGGIAWAGDVNTNIQYDATDSHPNAPGATIASVEWYIKDGTFVVGNINSTAITISFTNAGFRWILLVVTDSNGTKNIQRIPVWTFGGNYLPFNDFSIKRRSGEVRDSELSIEAFGDELEPDNPLAGDTSGVADNIGMIMYTKVFINGVEQPLNSACPFPGCGHIKFIGYALSESVRWDAETGEVSFKCVTLGKMADDLPGYPTFVKDVDGGSEDRWQTLVAPTVRSAIFWLWHWQSNLDTLAYMEILSVADVDPTPVIAGRNFPKAPPFKQAEAAFLRDKGLFALLGVSRWGSVHVRYDPAILDDAGRAAVTRVIDLTSFDWLEELQIDKGHRPALSSILGGGIHYDGADGVPYRGRSPGNVGRESGQDKRADNLIISGQADLNDKLGRLLAKLSSLWKPLPILTWYDIFEPALQELLTLTVSADENPRGYSFDTTTQWVIRRVEVKDEPGSAFEVRPTVEQLQTGFAGVTVAIPDPPSYPEPLPPPELPPFDPAEEPEEWPTAVYFGTKLKGIYFTSDFSGPDDSSQPTWATVNDGLPTTDPRQLGIDHFNREDRQFCLLETDRAIYRRENGGNWSTILTNAEARTAITALGFGIGADGFIMYFAPDKGIDGHMYVLFAVDGGVWNGIYWLKTNDYKAAAPTWTNGGRARLVNLNYNNVGNITACDGNVYIAYNDNGAPGKRTYVDFSWDSGGTWTQSGNLGISAWQPFCHVNPLDAGNFWANGNGAGGPDLVKSYFLAPYQDALNIGPLRPDVMWFHPSQSNTHYLVKYASLYTTSNGWIADGTTGVISPSPLTIAEYTSDDPDMILYGADPPGGGVDPHHIMAALGFDELAPTGKAGTNAGAGPLYTDAIPEDAGGPCYEAIQVAG